MSAARFPPGQHRRWTISARVLRPNEEGTQPGYPVETAASSVASERGKGRPWPARLEARAHLPDLIFAPGGNASAGRILVPEPEGDRLQKPTTVLSDEFELVSTRTIDLSLMPRRDRTTQ